MRILWVVGRLSLFPEVMLLLGRQVSGIVETGGWISASANILVQSEDVTLAIAIVTDSVRKVTLLQREKKLFFLLPHQGKQYKNIWKEVLSAFHPDVIHVHGTENGDNVVRLLNACDGERVVISMQGVIPAIAHYTHSGIGMRNCIKNIAISDFYHKDLLLYSRRTKQTLEKTNYIISKVNHVIGRTICDRAYTWVINPHAKYYVCNEILRDAFYSDCWEYDHCVPHTIFMSQATRPLKGLHILLRALPIVISNYPDTIIKIGGIDPTKYNTFMDKIKISGYGKYIKKEINHRQIDDVIRFLGPLSAEEMKREYLKANLFIIPSTIENSPNSLGEAQILGVPCLASYVGGIPDMIPNPQCGEIYRFDEIEVLAYKICQMFETSKTFDNTMMRQVAKERHDKHANIECLKAIYQDIVNY